MKVNSTLEFSPKPIETITKENRPIEAEVNLPVLTPSNQDEYQNVSERTVIDAIEKANKITINHNTRAEFSVHEVTKSIMVKIIDTEKNEVVREFPPKKFLDLVAKLWDLAGIIVDERR